MWVAAAFVGALGIDIASKWAITTIVMLPPRTIEIAPFFNVMLSFNTGVSFGLFRDFFEDRPLLLSGVKTAIAAVILLWALRSERRIQAAALGLIAGGAAGNIVDRVRNGAVTDFLDFHLGAWRWPTFNMADVAITLGAMLLITRSVVSTDKQASRSATPS